MKKEVVATTVHELPANLDLNELTERLIFIKKVEEGIKDVADGKVITHESMREKILSWRK